MKVTQSPPGVFILTDGGEGEVPVMVVKSVGGGLGTGVVSPSDVVMEDGGAGGGGVGTTPVYYTMLKTHLYHQALMGRLRLWALVV